MNSLTYSLESTSKAAIKDLATFRVSDGKQLVVDPLAEDTELWEHEEITAFNGECRWGML